MSDSQKDEGSERIGWDHPAIKLTGMAPDYLIRELYGYREQYWKQFWLKNNRNLWEHRNRKPWVFLKRLGEATSEDDDAKNSGASG